MTSQRPRREAGHTDQEGSVESTHERPAGRDEDPRTGQDDETPAMGIPVLRPDRFGTPEVADRARG